MIGPSYMTEADKLENAVYLFRIHGSARPRKRLFPSNGAMCRNMKRKFAVIVTLQDLHQQ
jgi:hypothetical protein